MVLSDRDIRHLIDTVELVSPFTTRQLQPASYDVRIQEKILIEDASGRKIPMVLADKEDRRHGKVRYIFHDEFVLTTTKEYFIFPDDLTAFVQGRSSIGRLGLQTQNAGFVDPGFEGEITLELKNQSKAPIDLFKFYNDGLPLAQLVFITMHSKPEKAYKGHYQGQKGPTRSVLDVLPKE